MSQTVRLLLLLETTLSQETESKQQAENEVQRLLMSDRYLSNYSKSCSHFHSDKQVIIINTIKWCWPDSLLWIKGSKIKIPWEAPMTETKWTFHFPKPKEVQGTQQLGLVLGSSCCFKQILYWLWHARSFQRALPATINTTNQLQRKKTQPQGQN